MAIDMNWLSQMMQGQGGGAPMMTPGAGMPPYRNAPMSMQPPQMQPPAGIPGAPPPAQPQQPINPAQMGMLSAMLAQNTRQPGGARPGEPVLQTPPTGADPNDPVQMGMLARMLGGSYGIPR